ncbi:hypothetical protein B0T16DRAFT_463459 [Cercophora newfieldiana]|uniref:Uncharacterized protein n=1 Tax=Cercophora newfieldiana TaxID=92897 RepID=A0AA39XT98_9PEZI|nr:hypothetical protein B0T16DRAFT_463459 [Cercophora newfieldiana]
MAAPPNRAPRVAGMRFISIAQDLRTARPVPCRCCIAYMLSGKPPKRAADQCRNYRVSCTDKTSELGGDKKRRGCLECSGDHKTCQEVNESMHHLVLDLQDKYKAAFGKAENSYCPETPANHDEIQEYRIWQDAAGACRTAGGDVLPGIRRLKPGEVDKFDDDAEDKNLPANAKARGTYLQGLTAGQLRIEATRDQVSILAKAVKELKDLELASQLNYLVNHGAHDERLGLLTTEQWNQMDYAFSELSDLNPAFVTVLRDRLGMELRDETLPEGDVMIWLTSLPGSTPEASPNEASDLVDGSEGIFRNEWE